jgi:hypothetical protein
MSPGIPRGNGKSGHFYFGETGHLYFGTTGFVDKLVLTGGKNENGAFNSYSPVYHPHSA